MLKRNYYHTKFELYSDIRTIKILNGIRGAGKSSIFMKIIDDLKEKRLADDLHIIYINFENFENDKLRNIEKLETYIRKKIIDKKTHHLFLDEVHCVPEIRAFIKFLHREFENLNIFICNSNSYLSYENQNSDFLPCLQRFYITPFSYTEACSFLNTDPKNNNMLLNYLKYGGFPARFQYKKSSEVKKYLYSILDSIFLRDIVMRLGVVDFNILFFILKILIKHLGKDFSILKLTEELAENDIKIPEDKLYTCLDCLCRALIVQPANGYNVVTENKTYGTFRYYLGDLGLAFLFGYDIQNNMDAILKNLVWLELKRRGYDIYTGINDECKFDFVAIRNEKTIYLQVVHRLEDGNTVNQEIAKLCGFDFNGQRYLLSLDRTNYSKKGVIHKNIIDFILEENSDIESLNEPFRWTSVE